MPLEKMGDFSFDHANQQDDLYKVMDAQEVKVAFDSRGNELKEALNKLIEQLESVTDGNSGADNVKMTPIEGLNGNTVQALAEELKKYADSIKTNLNDNYYKKTELLTKDNLEENSGASKIGIAPITGVLASNVQRALEVLKSQISQAATGNIPDGSITIEKLAFKVVQELDFLAHKSEETTNAHLAKNIGIQDTDNHFNSNNMEGALSELFTNVSDGKTLVGGAITGIDPNVVIPADPTFQQLAIGIGQISTGKKWASGSAQLKKQNTLDINNLGFTPKFVIVTFGGTAVPNTQYFGTVILSKPSLLYTTSTTKEPLSGQAWKGNTGYVQLMDKANMYIKNNGFYYLDTNIYVGDALYPTNIDWYAYE